MSFKRKPPMLKNFVSDIDRFLHEFDQKPEATSKARQAEEAKHERIKQLRDKKAVKAEDLD